MEFCLDHCENSSCETCDEKYYYGRKTQMLWRIPFLNLNKIECKCYSKYWLIFNFISTHKIFFYFFIYKNSCSID